MGRPLGLQYRETSPPPRGRSDRSGPYRERVTRLQGEPETPWSPLSLGSSFLTPSPWGAGGGAARGGAAGPGFPGAVPGRGEFQRHRVGAPRAQPLLRTPASRGSEDPGTFWAEDSRTGGRFPLRGPGETLESSLSQELRADLVRYSCSEGRAF